MLISIKEEHHKKVRNIYIPSILISLGASIATKVLSARGIEYLEHSNAAKEVKPLTKEQAKEIKAMLKYLNKNYKGLTIVDIQTQNEVIKIRI